MIKNPEKCEDSQITTMPMLVFASNDVLKPIEPLRKRMIFFTIDGALPSNTDKTAQESRGKAIIKKLGTGFYKEYLRRMLKVLKSEYEFIIYGKISDDYYPDLMKRSSEVFLSILKDYGYEIPDYFSALSWEKDYSSDAHADESVAEIGRFCKENKKVCHYTKNRIIIELGPDKSSQKQIESWKNILPPEMKATIQNTRDYSTISIDRHALEKHLGYRLNGFSFFKRN